MGGHSAQTLRHVAILHILHGTDAVKSLTYLKFGSNPTCYQLRPRKSFLVPMASRHLFTTTVDINIQRYPWFSWCHGQCPLLSAPGAAPQMPQTCDRSCISFSLDVSDGDMMFNLMSSFFRTASTPEICVAMEQKEKLLYFEWSPPWHVGWRLSGEGCHWEYDGKNGEFENIDFRFPWLSDTSEMGFGHDVPFLNYSDRLPHPSDLCQPDWVRWG